MSAGFEETMEQLGMTEGDISQAISRQLAAYGLAELDLTDRATTMASPIHGTGAFATRPFQEGEEVIPVRLGKQLTSVGCYVNHSNEPSCELVHERDGSHYLVALRDILEGEGLTHHYAEGRHAGI